MTEQELKEVIESRLTYLKKNDLLYSPIFGDVTYRGVINLNGNDVISIYSKKDHKIHLFDLNGRYISNADPLIISEECLLFPDRNRTPWEDFIPMK